MRNNMTPSPSPRDLLDRVLQDRPDAVKTRVLDLVLRLGINPDDELFLVMIALNHLQVLVEDTPNTWQNLFYDFTEELEKWTTTNLDVLNTLIAKAKNEEMLAEHCQKLIVALSNLTTTSSALMRQLNERPSDSSRLFATLTCSLEQLRQKTEAISNGLHRNHQTTLTMYKKLNAKAALPGWLKLYLFLLTALGAGNLWLLWQLQ